MRFSIEAEHALIGAVLIDSLILDDVLEIINEFDFYKADHQKIFSVMREMSQTGNVIDVIAIAEILNQQGELERVGGLGYLLEIAHNTPSAANALVYAQIIADRAMERRIAEAGQRLYEVGNDEGKTVDEKINTIHSELAAIERQDNVEISDFNDLLKAEVSDIDGRFRKASKPGLKTGFADLDKRFGGIEDSDLWILAARPSMGKTTLAMNIAQNVADQGGSVLIFSLEMSKQQLTKRLVSAASKINYGKLRSGELSEENWPQLSLGISKLKDKKIHIVDIAALDVNRAFAIARKLNRKEQLSLIVVDYLQLMTAKSDSRFDEISYISRQLKCIAKTIGCPVIALSQLSRNCESRPNKRPMNSDLRESGQIEQDADLISFIYRDEVYNPDSHQKGVAELITSKFRNGEIGTDYLTSMLQFSRFENMAAGYAHSEPEPIKNNRRGFR